MVVVLVVPFGQGGYHVQRSRNGAIRCRLSREPERELPTDRSCQVADGFDEAERGSDARALGAVIGRGQLGAVQETQQSA